MSSMSELKFVFSVNAFPRKYEMITPWKILREKKYVLELSIFVIISIIG